MAPLQGDAVPPPFTVVLTGGPSAGKSSALAILRDRLTVRGFQVLSVPENASHFLGNSDGFQPRWAGAWEQVVMQRLFLDYQVAQEDAFKEFAGLHPTKRGVLLCDCCTINGKLYVNDEQWEKVLSFPGKPAFTDDRLLSRYDLVIHLVTSANGGDYEWGPGSNNPARYHTPEQAKDADELCLKVFGAHPQMRVVPTFPSFGEKMGKVLHLVEDALHVEGLTGKRRRAPVRIKSHGRLLSVAALPGTLSFLVTSTFLEDQMQYSVRRRAKVSSQAWLEKCDHLAGVGGQPSPAKEDAPCEPAPGTGPVEDPVDVMYERRTHVKSPDPSKCYLTRRVIKAEHYNAELAVAGTASGVARKCAEKYVLSFVEGSHYYELFFFAMGDRRPGLLLDLAEEAPVPDWLQPKAREEDVSPNGERAPKRRVLGRHTTEAAAVGA